MNCYFTLVLFIHIYLNVQEDSTVLIIVIDI